MPHSCVCLLRRASVHAFWCAIFLLLHLPRSLVVSLSLWVVVCLR